MAIYLSNFSENSTSYQNDILKYFEGLFNSFESNFLFKVYPNFLMIEIILSVLLFY